MFFCIFLQYRYRRQRYDGEKQTQEQADEEMINQGFQELLDSYLATKHRKKVEIITKAFNFAKQAHKGVKTTLG